MVLHGKHMDPSSSRIMAAVPGSSRRDKQDDSRTTAVVVVRLLLHCTDGVVPFLTPHLLQRCFPAGEVADVLSLGLAVRDTCVVPCLEKVRESRGLTSKRKRGDMHLSTATPSTDITTGSNKPRGYTVSGAVKPDHWLLPYHRVTVPSFDLIQDCATAAATASDNDRNELLSATMQHVHVWTKNGRLVLTPDLYRQSVAGLHSHAHVPLFDMIPPPPPLTVPNKHDDKVKAATATAAQKMKRHKTCVAAVDRTRTWWRSSTTRSMQEQKDKRERKAIDNKNEIWMPLIMDPSSCQDDDDDDEAASIDSQLEWIMQEHHYIDFSNSNNNNCNKITGVALIGWQCCSEAAVRTHQLAAVVSKLAQVSGNGQHIMDVSHLTILATQSLRQILEVASLGGACNSTGSSSSPIKVVTVGTNLPTIWAQNKKAFVVDLNYQGEPSATTGSNSTLLLLDSNGCVCLNTMACSSSKEEVVADVSIQQHHPWYRDTNPLVSKCVCLTCQTHSRAYVYHLVCAKELLAEILLFIHNLHHMLELLRGINNCCRSPLVSQKEGNGRGQSSDDFIAYILSQLSKVTE
jgi:hypothetical protein